MCRIFLQLRIFLNRVLKLWPKNPEIFTTCKVNLNFVEMFLMKKNARSLHQIVDKCML